MGGGGGGGGGRWVVNVRWRKDEGCIKGNGGMWRGRDGRDRGVNRGERGRGQEQGSGGGKNSEGDGGGGW